MKKAKRIGMALTIINLVVLISLFLPDIVRRCMEIGGYAGYYPHVLLLTVIFWLCFMLVVAVKDFSHKE